MISFLADENISPETSDFLDALGYSCRSLRRDGPCHLSDKQIIALAKQENHVVLTHDLAACRRGDFGRSYVDR